MVLGRVTYEVFAAFWPRQCDDVPFATLNNTIIALTYVPATSRQVEPSRSSRTSR
jgi:hypothetical protein